MFSKKIRSFFTGTSLAGLLAFSSCSTNIYKDDPFTVKAFDFSGYRLNIKGSLDDVAKKLKENGFEAYYIYKNNKLKGYYFRGFTNNGRNFGEITNLDFLSNTNEMYDINTRLPKGWVAKELK